MEFNLNECVYVKLTDIGKKELKRQHDELKAQLPSLGEYSNPIEDENGFSKWQAWNLFGSLGHLLKIGFQVPFEPTIRIDI